MTKNKKMIKVMATLGCTALLGGVGLGMQNAAAEPDTLGGVDVTSFRMDYGASVRIKDTEVLTDNGIRFAATISDEAHDALEALKKTEDGKDISVDYGMVIVPYDYIESGKVVLSLATENNENGLFNGKFCFEDTTTGEHTGCEKTHLAAVTYEEVVDDDATDGVHNLRGSLINVKQNNLTRRFTGVGYIAYTYGETTEYALAGYAYDYGTTENANILNNTRSMTYVAQAAIKDNKLDATKLGMLEKNYVAPFADNEYAYTVNHYLPNENGVGYQNVITETLYGKLNTPVSAANIAKSSVADKAKYKDYATYGFTKDSNTSDIVFANGATELNCYYEARDTVLFNGSSEADRESLTKAYEKVSAAAISAEAEYTDANGEKRENLTKIVLTAENEKYGAGYLKLALQDEKLELANSANWDYLTVSMCMTTTRTVSAVNMFSKNVNLGEVTVNKWMDFVISKSFLNNTKSYLEPSERLSKEDLDAELLYSYAESNQALQNQNHNFFYTNTFTQTGENENVTYYIEKIEWGVDVTAPVITMPTLAKAYEGTYTPAITVTDDIIPNTAWSTNVFGPNYVSTVYAVDGDTRTEVATQTPGSWELSKGNYVLTVTANDGTATDVTGNVSATEEFAFEVIEKPVRAPGEMTKFDSELELDYAKAVNEQGVVPTISWESEYKDRTGVLVYASQTANNANYGGYFYLNFDAETINKIWTAYNDATTEFSLTLTMYVEISTTSGDYETNGVSLYGGKAYSYAKTGTKYEKDTWNDFTFNEQQLADIFGLNTSSSFQSKLSGSTYLFYLGYPTLAKNATVTYYVDSITYSTTPIVAE